MKGKACLAPPHSLQFNVMCSAVACSWCRRALEHRVTDRLPSSFAPAEFWRDIPAPLALGKIVYESLCSSFRSSCHSTLPRLVACVHCSSSCWDFGLLRKLAYAHSVSGLGVVNECFRVCGAGVYAIHLALRHSAARPRTVLGHVLSLVDVHFALAVAFLATHVSHTALVYARSH